MLLTYNDIIVFFGKELIFDLDLSNLRQFSRIQRTSGLKSGIKSENKNIAATDK